MKSSLKSKTSRLLGKINTWTADSQMKEEFLLDDDNLTISLAEM